MALENWVAHRPYAVFALLALAVLFPLLSPGFVLTLDMVFTPHIHLPSVMSSSYLLYAVLHILNFVIPADVLQKAVLSIILSASGYGMYRLCAAYQSEAETIGAYVAGTLYMVNPYTYDRFMAGQFAVLLGYSLLPFLVYSALTTMCRPSWLHCVQLGVWLTLIGIASIHTLGLAAVVLLAALVMRAWQVRREPERLRRTLLGIATATLIFLIASSYWLVPLALGNTTTAHARAGFTKSDDQAFATLGGSYIGRLGNIAKLQGFWAESTGMFALPQSSTHGWGVAIVVLWLLVGAGVVADLKSTRRYLPAMLLASGALGSLIAMGAFQGALEHVIPLFHGFREPDKFVGLLALAYAFFAGGGADAAISYMPRRQAIWRNVALIVMLLVPVLITPTMFWGFGGQLHARTYPATWAAMNTRLDQDRSSFQVLFLPWHLYMHFNFAGRIIASPATAYFDKPVITSNNLEYNSAAPTFPDPEKTRLSKMLGSISFNSKLGAKLAPYRIKYVLLDKDDDYQAYRYLDHQADLRLISDDGSFRLYINTSFRSSYATAS